MILEIKGAPEGDLYDIFLEVMYDEVGQKNLDYVESAYIIDMYGTHIEVEADPNHPNWDENESDLQMAYEILDDFYDVEVTTF